MAGRNLRGVPRTSRDIRFPAADHGACQVDGGAHEADISTSDRRRVLPGIPASVKFSSRLGLGSLRRRRLVAPVAVLASVVLLARAAAGQSTRQGDAAAANFDETIPIQTGRWTGDLDGMVKRRIIRVLVVYSKLLYFIDRGQQRGASYDAMRLFETSVNEQLKTGNVPLRVVFYPVERDQIIPMLLDGRGDVAAADLSITPDRKTLVDFSSPIISGVSEIVVTGPSSSPIGTLADLSGREVYVRKSSSYYESLERLNADFQRAGKPPVRLRLAPDDLQDEDLLEMLNAGLVRAVVVDDDIARLWSRIFDQIRLHPDVAVRRGVDTAWMFRKDSPRLERTIDAFLAKYPQGSLVHNEIVDRYFKSTRWVKNATSETELAKFRQTVDLFRNYGAKYDLDYLLMMAQGYQESQLDQSARSRVGAIGVMQVMPETGKAMGVGDIHELEPNIHAGVKYIRTMEDQYYAKAPMTDLNKGLFAFASYDAGPNRIEELRRAAAARGLDPNVWFNNVELVVAASIGRETVQYVSNIYKYYVAYTLLAEDEAREKKTLEELEKAKR
jgi:membrane-bound lytic murein transglycosylase MltF